MDEITAAGASYVAITPQTGEKSRELAAARKFAFPLLTDAGNSVADAYGLRWAFPDDLRQVYLQFGLDLAASNGDESWTLPIPARYIIDANGVVRYARIHPDYTTRPEPDETIEALADLS